jgi:putative membrane protein
MTIKTTLQPRTPMRPSVRFTLLAVASGLIAGCASLPGMRSEPAAPSDANIAAIVLAANNTDISYARVALSPGHAQQAEVRQFAEHMLSAHTGVNEMVQRLLATKGLAPAEHQVSLDLRDESAAKRDTLRELSGRAFDSTYIANEITYHRKVLAALDGVLIPSARDGDLKALLVAVRPAFVGHLDMALKVQGGLR